MELNLDAVTVTHHEEAHRFEAAVDDFRSLLAYRPFHDRLVLYHTEVPAPIEGQGIAAKLTRAALDFARANHLRVVPLCPYVSSFMRQHREYQDLLSPDDLQKLLSAESA
ncbi:MAG TPA: GNAT family N-acetyltransferase [Candidatus Acidoferrum sp.]|nr:GNAT family N-acetyltransferase [Candidatus Acidoferrum sp.]